MKAAPDKPSKTAAKSGQETGRSATATVQQTAEAAAAPTTSGPGLDRRSLQRLQGIAGNAAVSRLVAQRYTAPVKPPPSSAPGFRKVTSDVAAKKQKVAQHPPAEGESKSAQDAAKAPDDDKEAQGKVANSEKMDKAKPGEFDKQAFIDAVNKAIADQAPKNLDEAEKFSESGKAENVKEQVDGKVSDGKKTSAKDIESETKADPDTSAAKEKEVKPMSPDKPPANPGAPDAEGAVPDKQPDEVTDFSDGPKANDKAMADAEVTEEQLKKGNEPEFDAALGEKKKAEADSAKAPGEARGAEKEQLDKAKEGAAAEGTKAMAAMTAKRGEAGKQVEGGKSETKSKDEQKREQVTAKLQKVFDATKKDVEGILDGLDKKVDDQFTKGEKAARKAFEADQSRRMKEYKDKRYSGWTGKARWVKDKFAGLPDEANQLYQHSRKLYVSKMQGVISSIADTIGAELGKAKARIKKGRSELKAEVDKLPEDLKKYGQDAAKDFAGKFDDLESEVNDKSKQLVTDLATKYTEALNKVDERIKELQEANKGLIEKAKDAIVGVIKTINELKDLLLGILAKAAGAIMKIIKDPVGFLKNLVKAVGAGLELFISNIADHLKKGLVAWLLGTAVKAGIELPAKFDLKGIIQLIASTLGLTWDNIRARVTRKGVPDQAMEAVESQVPVAKALAKEGPSGAADEISAQVGDLKSTILEDLKSYLIPTVIIAGITWIVSLLNPASAFVRAVKAIIDIVSFVVNQGAQIVEFVNAVLDAVIEIANGGAAGVPKMVETALAASIPLLIGLLASLLGIGGLANKVKQVIQKASKPVNRAIDKIVDKVVRAGKLLWKKSRGREKNKRKNSHPASALDKLHRVARRTATRGWEAAAQRSANEVLRPDDLQSTLKEVANARGGVRVSLEIVESRNTWRVKARAAKAGKGSIAQAGRGWVAQGRHREPWYAARDLSEFNRSLVDSAFAELRGNINDSGDAGDLQESYHQKVKAGRRIEKIQQALLDGQVKGLRFSIVTEPFSRVKNDKEIQTNMKVTPNETSKTGTVPLNGVVFPFKIGKAVAEPIKLTKVRQPIENLNRIRVPMLGREVMNGYVVNMAAQPGEVEADLASRYMNQAWEGSESGGLATASTAVVIGVNTYKRLDPQENREGKNAIRAAMAGIEQPKHLRMAIMGFTWTPTWEHVTKGRVPLTEVREAYHKLSDADKSQAIADNESDWRKGKLPYGIFREAVLGSSHTAKAVSILSEKNQSVHIVSQDADGGVHTPSERGFLAEYSRILKAMQNDPILTIGGYMYDRFDWGELADSRTAQLTTLANVVDRAIRAAIAEVHPLMLYPTEPNSMMKAHDRRVGDGILQNPLIREGLDASQGSLYGVGDAEGRTARNALMRAYGREKFSVAYTPSASIVTSPLPDNRQRGLTITPEDVHEVANRERFPKNRAEHLRRSHRAYVLIMQSQTMASAVNLAREFRLANPQGLRATDQSVLEQEIFRHVEEMVKLMTDEPSLTMESDEIKERLAALEASAREVSQQPRVADREESLAAIELSFRIVDKIIEAMTAEDLRNTWENLHTLLEEIMRDPRPSQGGPR
ncbi:hypothetical protein H181DRAFT_03639 [Streptomyces sp. WMMB 714]|uniref:phage tail protein n=1 Tax=Streptomyces sp. WMMB 714 TaxID=1286822 RepID=UPI000823ED74|nr:hypothetical protein [Streptomyces sp. WMMB 714]SCK41836.1 hypothetical protein H181DRAFT_03639 [Streptomyces sp. WMMB 714]